MSRRTRCRSGDVIFTPERIGIGLGLAVAAGALALAGASLNSDPTTAEYGFAVECADTADKPTILSVNQQDMATYTKDYDYMAVGCGSEGDAPSSVELLSSTEQADILLTVRYHDGVMDSGAPAVTVETGGLIGFTGDSTITNWEVSAGEQKE